MKRERYKKNERRKYIKIKHDKKLLLQGNGTSKTKSEKIEQYVRTEKIGFKQNSKIKYVIIFLILQGAIKHKKQNPSSNYNNLVKADVAKEMMIKQ